MLSNNMKKQIHAPSTFFILFFLIPLIILTLPGCASFDFYTQAIHGQYKILINRQPIDKIIADPDTPAGLKKNLTQAMDIRAFAIETLKLPGQNHYLTYVDVKKPYVVWAVFAAPHYSIEPKIWCYPIVGCAVYRSYFSKQDAEELARQLQNQGYDVYVGGIKAYSTLGWFDDPVLSTYIGQGKIRLAALIFHELAHHLFYVKDDTTFNESFAQTVEQEGLRRWFIAENDSTGYTKYMDAQNRQKQFVQLILKYRSKLEMMYAKTIPISEKRQQKKQLLHELKTEYQSLKKTWNGFSGYDKWFDTDLNNAKLVTVAAYNDLVPAFLNILRAEGGNLEVFYNKCKDLSDKPREQRMTLMKEYQEGKFNF